MLGNLHVRFGVGAGAKLPGLHHADGATAGHRNCDWKDIAFWPHEEWFLMMQTANRRCGQTEWDKARSSVVRRQIQRCPGFPIRFPVGSRDGCPVMSRFHVHFAERNSCHKIVT